MIVTSSGRIIAGSRIIINDTVNEFLGTVNNLWSNPANWSLGVIPAANHIAIIKANCINANGTVRNLRVDPNVTLGLLSSSLFTTNGLSNSGTIVRSTGDGNATVINGITNTTDLGLINIATNGVLNINPIEILTDLTTQINNSSSINVLRLSGIIGIRGSISNITNSIQQTGSDTINVLDNLTINSIGGSGPLSTIRLLNGVKLEANNINHDGNGAGILCDGNNEIIVKGNYTVSYGYQIPVTVPVIFRANSTFRINNNAVPPYVHNIVVDNVVVTTIHAGSNFFTLYNTKLSGTTSSSEFVLQNGHTLHFLGNTNSSVEDLMSTGILTLQSGSTLNYILGGNQYIKPISYRQLGIMTSGVKYLKANTTCEHLYFSGTATLDLNGFTLTGYTKYTDEGNVPRTVPNDASILEYNLTGQHGQAKTLTGNITCNIMNVNAAGAGSTYINYNGFTITASIFNDMFNMSTHVGGVRDNMHWTNFGLGTITLASPITIRGILRMSSPQLSSLVGGCTMADGSTFKTNNGAGSTYYFPMGISSYSNVDLVPFTNQNAYTVILRQNIVVRGTYTRPTYVIFNKNGFTIKDSLGNDLE
ncbi:hypothetical protein [Pedobacter sp. ASV28]|uniref:hypothetical protein n=1 Tax=Pedobacter sp. ASV28 TaxID=2795123 RepID=UPI0018EDF617|nr:hypothetical protein [Pedobacter sp. ASV28]